MLRAKLPSAAVAGLSVYFLFAGLSANAETLHFKADLKGSEETPPNDAHGAGTLQASYDTETKKLTWTVTYSGLTGPATAAHFHGPATAGKTAGIEVPAPGADKSPIEGSATLTDAQAKDLLDGLIYFNIHTDAHKPGELRGQVVKGM
ncbi:MAG: CHRD domain-containing protein [Beijerinckiaceae bacterium]